MKYIILLSIFILVIKCWVIDTQDLKCLTSQTHKNEPTREENLFGQVILILNFDIFQGL